MAEEKENFINKHQGFFITVGVFTAAVISFFIIASIVGMKEYKKQN